MAKHQLELFDTFPIRVSASSTDAILSDSKEEVKSGYSLVCELDATHAGTIINNRIYPPESMQKGIRSWTSPYKKPVLTNHDDTKDPIGRVVSARYLKTDRGTDMKEYKPILRESEGYGYQRLTVKITEPEAIKKILDGRYETVSVRMSTDHCWCSICKQDWSGEDGPCDHTPGTKYEGKLAYMTTGDLNYREVSFVNIPADEYAGVKEAVVSDNKDALSVKLYANNDEEKILSDLGSGKNLYALIDSEAEESDNVVAYLLDKSKKSKTMHKEEDVKLSELTKDQLKDLEIVKAMIKEAVDKAIEDTTKELTDKASKDCEQKMKDMAEAAAKDAEDKKKKEEAEEEEDKKKKEAQEQEEEDKKKKKKEEEEEEEEDKKKKKTAPSENKGSGKTGGSKHGAGNQSPTGEDPGDTLDLAKKVEELEKQNKNMLDENVKINAELHKMVAERLYDLKKNLRKPDVVSISTPDARDKKVEEFAQRSIDSLKDQINDLITEQASAPSTGSNGKGVESPAISASDTTNEVVEDKKKVKLGKQETLTRLFPKSK